MQRHRFDPISAALGLLAGVAGALVALGGADDVVDEPGWWIAVALLVVGVALVPWTRAPADESAVRSDPIPDTDPRSDPP
jgi:hypothetical protein